MRFEEARVECYAGGKGAEAPRVIHHLGRKMVVAEVLDRWYEGGIDPTKPRLTYFKVLTEDGGVMILKFEEEWDRWFIKVPDQTLH